MSEVWVRFEGTRQRQNEFATIMKDGRLVIRHSLAKETGIVPETHVEIYYIPEVRKIGILPVPNPTPYSLRVGRMGGKAGEPFDVPGLNNSLPSACVHLRTFLNSRHIGLASKLRGEIHWDKDRGMLVFSLSRAPQIITPAEHMARQLESMDGVDRVIGDGTQPLPEPANNKAADEIEKIGEGLK